MKQVLLITKTELTRDGVTLTARERSAYYLRAGFTGPDTSVVRHFTVLHSSAHKTTAKAYAAATPELIDSLGLVWNASAGTYSTEYFEYDLLVTREDRASAIIGQYARWTR
jgi:hypothetical protein